ncbi:MAG: sigma-70 family RNA polymerase sigma factor [Steroidobacteraceae bacterium]
MSRHPSLVTSIYTGSTHRGLTRINACGALSVFDLRHMNTPTQSRGQREREALFAQLGRYMNGLYRYARHLLRYYEAQEGLPRGQIEVEDIVDAAVLETYRELGKAKDDRDIRRLLMRNARRYVQTEVEQVDARRELTISKEDDVPETPPAEEVMRLGEDMFEFFEPEEDLKVEDVVPDLDVPTPEEVTDRIELQQCVDSALAGIPAEWRRALELRFVRGLKGAALARELGKPGSETSRVLERARAYLKQRLVEAGCVISPQNDRAAKVASSP